MYSACFWNSLKIKPNLSLVRLNKHYTMFESEFSLFPSLNKEKSLCHVAMLISKIPGSEQTVALQLYARKKIWLFDFPMIALRTFLSSFNNTNHEMAISVLKGGLLRSRNLVTMLKWYQAFLNYLQGTKIIYSILSENSLFSQRSTVCSIDIFVFKKVVSFCRFYWWLSF